MEALCGYSDADRTGIASIYADDMAKERDPTVEDEMSYAKRARLGDGSISLECANKLHPMLEYMAHAQLARVQREQ